MPIIPVTWEVEIRRVEFKVSLGNKLAILLSQSVSQTWWYMLMFLAIWESRRIAVQG
jgi:hypothetical protein